MLLKQLIRSTELGDFYLRTYCQCSNVYISQVHVDVRITGVQLRLDDYRKQLRNT